MKTGSKLTLLTRANMFWEMFAPEESRTYLFKKLTREDHDKIIICYFLKHLCALRLITDSITAEYPYYMSKTEYLVEDGLITSKIINILSNYNIPELDKNSIIRDLKMIYFNTYENYMDVFGDSTQVKFDIQEGDKIENQK